MEVFNLAVQDNTKGSLAFYYLGTTCVFEDKLDIAEEHFKKGLETNKASFKCMTGLFEVLFKKRRFPEAYKIGTELANSFPLGIRRLEDLLHVVIHNKKFSDVEIYYERFCKLETRDARLDKCMTVALLIAGKYYCVNKNSEKALLSFNQLATTSHKSPEIYKEVISTLAEGKYLSEAEAYLKEIQNKLENRTVFQGLKLLLTDYTASPASVIEQGTKLISQGVYDPVIYELMIKRSAQEGLKEQIEPLFQEAVKKWPNLAEKFQMILEKTQG